MSMKKRVFRSANSAAFLLAAFAIVAFIIRPSLVASQAAQKAPAVEVNCHDTGSFSLSNVEKQSNTVTIRKSGGASSKADGTWRQMSNGLYKFTSDDMAVVDVQGGTHIITVDRRSYSVKCPPFTFSCKLINLSINSCYKRNDTFFGKYTAYSYRYDKKNEFRFEKPFMLTYEVIANVDAKKRELTHAPAIKSPEFKAINISRVRRVGSNTYTLRWQTPLNVSKLMVRYDDCQTPKYTFYDSFICTERPACNADRDCTLPERCDDGFCIPISCGSCQYVSNHTCIDHECCTDLDCESGYSCTGSKCQPLSCDFNEEVAEHSCEKLECSGDEYVFNHTCRKLNCRDDEQALNHICTVLNCKDDETATNHTCTKLSCGFLRKVSNHKCVSMFSLWFGRK